MNTLNKTNFFDIDKIPALHEPEIIDVITKSSNFRIERIVSSGQHSTKDFWYNQKENEWVILLKGNATLEFENSQFVELKEGDYILIPCNKKHRIVSTSQNPECVWLAVFFQ
ncbi:MAG: cupin domain-containing protein [Bacteroidetes bacterium]|nr:cupin domain-containing protein [Bacteroidota bacterium]